MKKLLFIGMVFLLIGCSQQTMEPVSSFEECEAAGYDIMESYPRKCTDGTNTFTEELENNCEDQCGDGLCAEIVCMELGCPCAETVDTCPQDCAT
jgi:hypothetical protein